MKKLSFLFIVLFAVICSATAQTQTTKTIQLSFNASDFTTKIENGLTYIESSVHELFFDTDTLEPALPHINVYVLIGNDQTYTGISVSKAETPYAYNVIMAPNEPVYPLSEDIPERETSIPHYLQLRYPQDLVEFTGEHIIDGSKVLSFRLSPFMYESKFLKLYLNTSLLLSISLQTDVSTFPKGYTHSAEPSAMVKQMVVNPNETISNTDTSNEIVRSILPDYEAEYLIVTNENQKSQYQMLADWKTKKGVRTTIITVEEIASVFPGNDLQYKIKNALTARNFLGEGKLKYVLLGGTNSIIPARRCMARRPDGTWDELACDMYYGCMTSLEWDTNGNGIFGELDDHINLAPELIVSRLPTTDAFDAGKQISRIIQYEQYGYPVTQPIHTNNYNILMSGKMITRYYTQNGLQCSDAQIVSGKMYDTYISPYWSGQLFRFFDTVNDFQDNSSHPLTYQNLISEINEGYLFINMHCHGSSNFWVINDDRHFISSDILSIHNPQNSIIFSNSCMTNNIIVNDCLGYSFMSGLNSNQANIVAFIGPSGVNFITGNNIGPTEKYYGNTYKNLFTNPHHRLAEAFREAKIGLISECNSNNAYRYSQFSLNLLGDPEMPVHLSLPQVNNHYSYFFRNDTLVVVPGVAYSTVCIMRKNSDGDLEYYQVNHGDAISRFLLGEGTYTMTISAPGYKPVIINNISQQRIFIQNQTITTDSYYEADEIYIGKDVTSTQSQGPVSITAGTTTIKPRDYVQIKNSFTLGLGAQLKILKSN